MKIEEKTIKLRSIIILLMLILSIPSFSQNKKSFLRNGNDLYSDSSYNDAEIQYRKSLEKDQDYFNASFNLADAIYKQERFQEASALFDALKDNAPNADDLAKVYHNLGNSLVKEQKLEEAIDAYKSALRIKPEDENTRHNLALSKQKKQEQQEQQEQQDNQDDKKQENQDDKKQKNQDDKKQQNQEEKQQKQPQEKKEEKQQKQPQEKKEEMSKEDAEKMLEAIQQQEKELQEELQKKQVKGKRVNVLKDW